MTFDVEQLAGRLERACPEAKFAFLFGSAREGHVHPQGDIDVALYVDRKEDFDCYARATEAVQQIASGTEPDVSLVTMDSDVILRFEILKGRLLFCRDQNAYLDFFSLTCREYEDQMADYQRQHHYRLNVAAHPLRGDNIIS